MELQEVCSKISEYYGLYINEYNRDVSKMLWNIILYYYQILGNMLIQDPVYGEVLHNDH